MSITSTYLLKSYLHKDFNQQGDSYRQLHPQRSESHGEHSELRLFQVPECLFVCADTKSKKQNVNGSQRCWTARCGRLRATLCQRQRVLTLPPTADSYPTALCSLPRPCQLCGQLFLPAAVPTPLAAGRAESLHLLLFSRAGNVGPISSHMVRQKAARRGTNGEGVMRGSDHIQSSRQGRSPPPTHSPSCLPTPSATAAPLLAALPMFLTPGTFSTGMVKLNQCPEPALWVHQLKYELV